MRKRPLLWFACVFLCGLAFGKYENIFMFYAFLLCIGIEIYHGVRHSNVWKLAGRSIVLLSVFLLGMWHMKTEENFRARYMSILEQNVQLVGLSALMTTTVVSMEECIQLLREKAPNCKVMVGGAVLNKEYADMIGADFYGKDAMQSVYYAQKVFAGA